MKLISFLTLCFLISCSHAPTLKQQTHLELTDLVMRESLLTNALGAATVAAPNCVQPFESNMPKPVFNKLMQMIAENFKYEDSYKAIREKLIAGTDKNKMLEIAEQLDSKVWKKFIKSIPTADDNQQFTTMYKSLDEGTFDLQSRRSQLVAKITDHAFMVNLVSLSNSQVMKMMPSDLNSPQNHKQKNVLEWISKELQTFNDAHIKALFANTYLSTEGLSENELEELLKIRSNEIMKLGKTALEQELLQRYHNFFKQMVKIRDGK